MRAMRIPAAFRLPGYLPLWLAGAASAVTFSATSVAVGWLALEDTGSSFAVGLTFAARLTPALVLGIPIGVMVDRVDRRRLLVLTNAGTAAVGLALATGATAGGLGIAALIAASLAFGALDTVRGTAGQAYAFDLAGPTAATKAIALLNLGAAVAGSAGAVAGGVVLDQAGAAETFAVAGIAAALGAVILLRGRSPVSTSRRPDGAGDRGSAFTLLAREPIVRHIVVLVVAGEVLGFATLTLFPAFAQDVLRTDAAGLGAMTAARSIGGFLGLLLVTRWGLRNRAGWYLLAVTGLLGGALAALAISGTLGMALAVLLIVGAAMSILDTIGQALVQQHVPDHERGAAVGIWFFAIGFGPFGHLGLGALAGSTGVATALLVSGLALALVAALAAWRGPMARVA